MSARSTDLPSLTVDMDVFEKLEEVQAEVPVEEPIAEKSPLSDKSMGCKNWSIH